MKTLTEFPGMNIKAAAKIKHDLIVSGKTAEEIPTSLGESLKLEENRLALLLNALELVGTHLNDLKRVVVYSLNEGETAPTNGPVLKGEHYYLVEYFPSLEKKSPQKEFKGKGRGNKGGRRGKGDRKAPRERSHTQAVAAPAKPPQKSETGRRIAPLAAPIAPIAATEKKS